MLYIRNWTTYVLVLLETEFNILPACQNLSGFRSVLLSLQKLNIMEF